jgi:antitoxin component YwqK of YwqJK toxin-antitoxin module
VVLSWGRNSSAWLAGIAAAAVIGGCSHAQTLCPRGASLARRIYSGGGEAEWCHRDGGIVRHGAEVRYYDSGVKLMEGVYVDGVEHGTWRYYWNTGEMWREENWNDGEMIDQKIVTRAAKLSAAARSELGYGNSGVIKLATDPMLHRRQVEQEALSFSERYPDGKPRTLGRYDGDGARWGVWWFWYPNGQLAREVEYQGGVRHRGFREWYDSGTPRTDGAYYSGRKDSRWRRWNAGGQLIEEQVFRNGSLVPAHSISGDSPVIESPP